MPIPLAPLKTSQFPRHVYYELEKKVNEKEKNHKKCMKIRIRRMDRQGGQRYGEQAVLLLAQASSDSM